MTTTAHDRHPRHSSQPDASSRRRRTSGLLLGATAIALTGGLLAAPAAAAAPANTPPQARATATDPAPVLRLGSRGADVRAWQSTVNNFASPRIAVDGIYGPRTAAATRQLQRFFGFPQDGVVGPTTVKTVASFLASDGVIDYGADPNGPALRVGSSGQAVSEWQSALVGELTVVLQVDGRYGPRTRAATVAFQQQQGLVPDGIAGPKTRTAMAKARAS